MQGERCAHSNLNPVCYNVLLRRVVILVSCFLSQAASPARPTRYSPRRGLQCQGQSAGSYLEKKKKRVGKYIHRNTAINKLVTQEQAIANAYSPQHRCKQIHSTFTLRARSSLKNKQSQQTFRRSLKPLMQLRKQFSDRRKNKLGGRTPTRGPRAPLPKKWKRRACQRISPRRRARISAPCTPCDRLPCPRQSGLRRCWQARRTCLSLAVGDFPKRHGTGVRDTCAGK